MSRYCGKDNPRPIFEAAIHWRDVALVGEGSVFTNKKLWTNASLDSLDRHFVQRPDLGDGKFLAKLQQQLLPADAAAKQLAAEMMWMLYLCPSSLTSDHKRQTVQAVWSWSGEDFPSDSPWLANNVLVGIGSAGPGFNQNQWRELVFLINFARRFRTLDAAEQQRLVADAWSFDEWLRQVPDWDARQFRHMLLFALFPDDFERIFGQNDRKTIVRHFSKRAQREVNRMDPVQLDRELQTIRKALEAERGTAELDYYVAPLRDVWKVDTIAVATEGATGAHVRKATAENELADTLNRFLVQAEAGTDLGTPNYLGEYRGLKVKVSFGKGNFARIPWIAFLGEGQSVSQGIYPVLLLFKEEGQLLLCYGVSEENPAPTAWGKLDKAVTVKEWFLGRYNRQPDRYGASIVRASYDVTLSLPASDLQQELDQVIDIYERVLRSSIEIEDRASDLPVTMDLSGAVGSFAAALRESDVRFGEQHDTLVASFIASVATKPLVILTGLSGSGKTQIAIRFGEWLGARRLHVAAVRPDWTGTEALFGYEDGLKPAVDGRAVWSVPEPLEFMLRAVADPQHPYLLLLDEMNLAHVERYLADVLSGMESGKPCLPNLQIGQDGCWRQRSGGELKVPIPRNLWVVGTVNVDETTYMFSPKVLDRANTFEFRVQTSDLMVNARKPRQCAPGDGALVRGLLSIARDDDWHLSRPASFHSDLASQLSRLHQLLSRYNLEFGHRVFYEALRFGSLAEESGLQGIEGALDRIVMQKILPRLHGSRRRLELPLLALAEFCRDLPEALTSDEKLPALGVETFAAAGARLPTAHAKVVRMLQNLRANQFASFTE